MAAGLFHRPAHGKGDPDNDQPTTRQQTVTDEHTVTTEPTTGRAQVDERETVRERAVTDTDTAAPRRHPLAFNGGSVPPGGAVAPPPEPTSAKPEPEPTTDVEPTPEPRRWARTSFAATLSLVFGVCAVLAALSGRLAPVAVAIGAVGLVLSAIGLAAVSRRKHVTGHHVALLGLLASIAGVVLGILAINKSLPWLDSGADNVGHLRGWLDARLPFMRDW
jgi:hypothetical protein